VARPKQRTPQLRERVLTATVELLADRGPDKVTTRQVAQRASTSVAAVYELFGDKDGLVREVFVEGFRRLGSRLAQLPPTADPRADVLAAVAAYRGFVQDNPMLARVMFSRPLAGLDLPADDARVVASGREAVLGPVRRAVAAGLLAGDPTDVAHVLLALAQGLAGQESAGWLGTTQAARDRRWRLAFDAALGGLAPRTGAATAAAGAGPDARVRPDA
jgi:AcrR family transcriptional regulator